MSDAEPQQGQLRAGDLTIDYDRRRVLRGDDEIRLTPKEFELLSLLARNHDRVLTHRAILKAVWGAERRRTSRSTSGRSSRSCARRSNSIPRRPKYLLSEPWVGYRFATGDRAKSHSCLRTDPRLFRNFSGTSEPDLRWRFLRCLS